MFCQTNYTDKSFFSANFLLEQCMNEPKCVWCEWVCLCTCFCQWNQIQEKQKKHTINTGRIGKLVIFLRALRLRMQIVWKFTKCEMNQRSLACLLGTDVELFFRLMNKRKIIHKNIVHRFFFFIFPIHTNMYIRNSRPSKLASVWSRTAIFWFLLLFRWVFFSFGIHFHIIIEARQKRRRSRRKKQIIEPRWRHFYGSTHTDYLHTNSPNPYPNLNQKFQFR